MMEWFRIILAAVAMGLIVPIVLAPVFRRRVTGWVAMFVLCVGALALTACAPAPLTGDVGCTLYQAQRGDMPRPIGTGPLAEWVAGLDATMTGGCR